MAIDLAYAVIAPYRRLGLSSKAVYGADILRYYFNFSFSGS